MSTAVEDPATVRELTRYVEHEHPALDTPDNARREQLVVVGQPGRPEPPAALREIIASNGFEMRAQTVASRSRWLGVIMPQTTEATDDPTTGRVENLMVEVACDNVHHSLVAFASVRREGRHRRI